MFHGTDAYQVSILMSIQIRILSLYPQTEAGLNFCCENAYADPKNTAFLSIPDWILNHASDAYPNMKK